MNMIVATNLPAASLFDLYDLMAPIVADESRETGATVDVTLTNLPQHVLDAVEQTMAQFGVTARVHQL